MLTERQSAILYFIHQYISEYGFGPSIREMGDATGISSTSVVNHNIERLVSLGYLVKSPGKSRAFALTSRARELFEDDLVTTDTDRLREENRLLRADNERLCRESKNRVAALQREIQYLSRELRQVQQSSERYPA